MTITDQIIKALCNTLVYSLWQGIILAAVAGIIVIATRKSSSAVRYNLLTGVLALFAVGSVVTFFTQFKLVHNVSHVLANTNNAVLTPAVFIRPVAIATTQTGNVWSVLSSYLDNYHNTIVCVWFLIICIKSIQFGVGLYGTYILKRTDVFAPDKFWKERALQLACITGIKQTIDMLESGLAKVPMVIGHLKPIILVPIGLLAALSPDEIEAIIVHELAHIKRRDYLVNMLQSLMEIIFFFNPAVLWISNLIKVERENCCDDIVLAQNGSRSNYIHALVSCEEFQTTIPAYAMALAGNKNNLLNRVKRMANNRNNSLNQFEKAFLAVCLVMSGLCLSAFAAKDKIKHTVHEVVKVLQHQTIDKQEEQKLAENTVQLQEETAKVNAAKPVDTSKKPVAPKAPVNVVVPPVPVNADPQAAPNVVIPPVSVNINPPVAPKVAISPITVNVPQAALAAVAALKANPLVNVTVHPQVQLNGLGQVQVHLNNINVHLNGLNDTIRYKNSAYYRTYRAIVNELYGMKLITDTNNVSLHLNEKELNVNGVRMTDEVHKVIFEKFGKNGEGYGYSNSNGGNYNYSYSGPGYKNSNYSYSYSYDDGHGNSASASASAGRAADIARESADRARDSERRARENADRARENADRARDRAKIYEDNAKQMTEDLLKDGLISDSKNVNFRLTTKEFILNGKKQSDAVFEKYKKKYAPASARDSWNWNHSSSSN